jgi:hypothetical protein
VRARVRDREDIDSFVDKLFKDSPNGMVYNTFEYLCLNYSSELLYVVLNCFTECLPCYRNFIRGRSNFYGNQNIKSIEENQEHYFVNIA